MLDKRFFKTLFTHFKAPTYTPHGLELREKEVEKQKSQIGDTKDER